MISVTETAQAVEHWTYTLKHARRALALYQQHAGVLALRAGTGHEAQMLLKLQVEVHLAELALAAAQHQHSEAGKAYRAQLLAELQAKQTEV